MRNYYTAPKFDLHQFARRALPVRATYGPQGCESTGIDYSDFSRSMSVQDHKFAANRTLDAPEWAFNETARRELLLCYCEHRAGMRGWRKPASMDELRTRLDAALFKIREQAPRLEKTLDKCCAEYVALKAQPTPDAKRLRALEIEIQSIDTQLVICRRVAEIVLGVIVHYYCLGNNSVETAAHLSIRPPHVREITWRLRRHWQRMQAEPKAKPRKLTPMPEASTRGRVDPVLAAQLRAQGFTYKAIAEHFGVTISPVVSAIKTFHRKAQAADTPQTAPEPQPQPDAPRQATYGIYGVVTLLEESGSLTKIRTQYDDEFWVKTALLKRARVN